MDDKTRAENFKRVAGLRVANCLEAIRKLENLNNHYQYAYTRQQLDKMFNELERAVVRARDVLEGRTNKTRNRFEL